jgi:oligopeptide/dipeptide ABC transporter ATP-binding protein
MDLLEALRRETGMALILITHDIGVVAETADRVAVMYAGRIVETGSIKDVLMHPVHPYTRGLLHSMPQAQQRGEPLQPIVGSPPNLAQIPMGCAFHPRCPEAGDTCGRVPPTLKQIGPAHFAECYNLDDV